MTWAPWAAASRAASSCLSIIASLVPAQSVCSKAARMMSGHGSPVVSQAALDNSRLLLYNGYERFHNVVCSPGQCFTHRAVPGPGGG